VRLCAAIIYYTLGASVVGFGVGDAVGTSVGFGVGFGVGTGVGTGVGAAVMPQKPTLVVQLLPTPPHS